MRITISSASNSKIDEKYLKTAKNLLDYLVTIDNVELNWGSCSVSVMGKCYETFKNAGKKIYGYTTKKYADDIKNLPSATHSIFDNTFDLKKGFFYDADIIICLAGGIGTISEFFSYLEEIRSNDQNKLLIIYDEDYHFDSIIKIIDELIEKKFSDKDIYNYFKVIHNIEEFKRIINENIITKKKALLSS